MGKECYEEKVQHYRKMDYIIVLNFIPDHRSSKNCMGTVSFFTVLRTRKVIEHDVGRERGHIKLRVSMENKFEQWWHII